MSQGQAEDQVGVAEVRDVHAKGSQPNQLSHNFDFVNWFYWAIWWQQCSYYLNPQFTTSNSSVSVNGNIGGNISATSPGQSSPIQRIGIQIRIVNGYETVIAPLWKRLLAELLDMFLFGLLLKFYIPDFEHRVPEIIFESNDVWKDISEEELLEIRQLVIHFLVSTIIQRITHAVFETLFLSLFGWTPGKWLLGLRVIKCTTSHLTRTIPGGSVRVEPGGRLPIINAALRSFFKGTVSAFIPLVIFFFNIPHGRTRYDKLFSSIVVDVSSLYRPLFVNNHQIVNLNLNQGGNLQVHIR